jgi:hypothetical protein
LYASTTFRQEARSAPNLAFDVARLWRWPVNQAADTNYRGGDAPAASVQARCQNYDGLSSMVISSLLTKIRRAIVFVVEHLTPSLLSAFGDLPQYVTRQAISVCGVAVLSPN